MNYSKYLQFIASFMIVLVLTLPFYTTSVYAGINSISAKGSDAVEGFVKKPDYIDFKVRVVSDTGSAISPSQLKLGSETLFSQCTELPSEGYECIIRWPAAGTYPFDSGIEPYEITFTEDGGSSAQSGSVIVDDMAPEVAVTTPKNLYYKDEEITIDYDVTDYACSDAACNNQCSGIDKIEFFILSDASEDILKTIEPTAADCNIKDKTTLISPSLVDGPNSIYARATDKFGHATTESVEFNIDMSVPSINTNTFLVSRKGVILSSYSSNAIIVDANVTVTETSLTLESVWGNFTNLSKTLSQTNAPGNVQQAACAQIGTTTTYKCTWQGLQFEPGSSAIRVTINASDTAGNRISNVPITRTLTKDDNGPVVNTLTTGNEVNSQFFGKPTDNTVIATFNEATGIAADEVFLYVGSTRVNAADNCTKQSANTWRCEWGDVALSAPSTTISIKTDTKDVLGNAVAQDTSIDVIVDTQAPILAKGPSNDDQISVLAIGGEVEPIPGIFKVGDMLYVEANVTDENTVTAKADFSDFILGASSEIGSCSLVDDKWKCTWTTTNAIDTPANGNIRLTFTDVAGNSLPKDVPLQTLGLDGRPAPDFWKSTFRCSPRSSFGGNATIDRSTANLINQVVYCIIALDKNNENDDVSTASIFQSDECVTDDDVFDAGIFGDEDDRIIDILNNDVNSTSPIIRIELIKDGNYDIDDAPLQCPIAILSKVKQADGSYRITQNEEIENVNINITFYNLPLGELSQGIKDKIHDAKKRIKDLEAIAWANKNLINIAKKICQLIHTAYTIVSIFHAIHVLLGGGALACTLFGGGPACQPIEDASQRGCKQTDNTNNKVDDLKEKSDKFCDYVTCKKTLGWGNDVKDFINNLPLAGWFGQTTEERERARSIPNNKQYDYIRDRFYGSRQLSDYMNPNDNLFVAALFGCISGVIGNLEKYRQIQCMYADCLENGVGREGLPATACENQKSYATCKYVTGEAFALIPWVAVFDHFTGIIKEALSNPFTALGVVASLACGSSCKAPRDGRVTYILCRGLRGSGQFFSAIGDAAQNVALLSNEGFKIRNDYCSRISLDEESTEEEEGEPTPVDT